MLEGDTRFRSLARCPDPFCPGVFFSGLHVHEADSVVVYSYAEIRFLNTWHSLERRNVRCGSSFSRRIVLYSSSRQGMDAFSHHHILILLPSGRWPARKGDVWGVYSRGVLRREAILTLRIGLMTSIVESRRRRELKTEWETLRDCRATVSSAANQITIFISVGQKPMWPPAV